MGLEELQKQLYKKDAKPAGRPEIPSGVSAPEAETQPEKLVPEEWPEEQINGGARRKRRRIFWFLGILAILLIFGLASWFLWRGWHSFDKAGVTLNIFGSERVVNGEEVSYIVRYKNNTKVVLKNTVLNFIYAEQSLPSEENLTKQGVSFVNIKNLGDLSPSQEGQIEFKARVLGDKDSQQKFSAKLNYQPQNISSVFSNGAEFASTVISVPLVLSFDLPQKIVSGQNLNFSLQYINTAEVDFSDLRIKIEWPEGFVFTTAFPSPAQSSNVWNLDKIASQEEGKILISGVLSGGENDNKVFKAQIGVMKDNEMVVYAQALSTTLISVSPLYVEQKLSGSENSVADLGQTLNYELKYRNTTEVPIGPISITLKIESRAVDFTTAVSPGGYFDSNNNTISWDNFRVPALNSLKGKEEGKLSFSFKLKEQLAVSTFSDKNFSILTTAEINSPNTPLELSGTQIRGENKFTVKINSQLIFNMQGYYTDSLISNSGPLPPKVGQKTTYTIHWQILNISNNLSEVEIQAILPSNIEWLNNISPQDSSLKYDALTNKITWKLGKLAAGIGVLLPVKLIAFQVGLTPSVSQVGDMVDLIKSAQISAQDDFTGQTISVSADDLKTNLPDDPTVGWEKGKVVD